MQNIWYGLGREAAPFLVGWIADHLLGDPEGWWHPVVTFGRVISAGEKKLNRGNHRFQKGLLFSAVLMIATFGFTWFLIERIERFSPELAILTISVGVFYCLAGKTLKKEVTAVFKAVDIDLDNGRKQVARIVGRDTSQLTAQEIRAAALETYAENLSDGVIAPMFWFAIAGLPGMLTYKMVNTLDSMVGYRTERYEAFGKAAARIDDIANYIPARLTAILMLIVSGHLNQWAFLFRYGKAHKSPNSGYPEAALAAILNGRFGGTHTYFGEEVYKPFIGTHERSFVTNDLYVTARVCDRTEWVAGLLVFAFLIYFI